VDKINTDIKQHLQRIYTLLYRQYGPQHWWPGDGQFEMMVGAILTQSTSWANVEKAIQNLRKLGALSPAAVRNISDDDLAILIRSSGYYHIKTKKLKALACWLGEYHDDLAMIFSMSTEGLRRKLLNIYGIGEETADSILLYAAGKPVFVIDAYTRRIIDRIGIQPSDHGYSGYQQLFKKNLTVDAVVFNEYHALLVQHGKSSCQKHPVCRQCCLSQMCKFHLTGQNQYFV